MRAVRRFLTWLADSAPVFSWRRCCTEWELGRQVGRKEVGLTRDARGRFQKVAP